MDEAIIDTLKNLKIKLTDVSLDSGRESTHSLTKDDLFNLIGTKVNVRKTLW